MQILLGHVESGRRRLFRLIELHSDLAIQTNGRQLPAAPSWHLKLVSSFGRPRFAGHSHVNN